MTPRRKTSTGSKFCSDRGAVCAECRRLKMRCDRKVPCTSCVKRGYAAICPDGTQPTGQGHRIFWNTTSTFRSNISEYTQRISELEEALRAAHSLVSGEPHPLLLRNTSSPGPGNSDRGQNATLPVPHNLPTPATSPETFVSEGTDDESEDSLVNLGSCGESGHAGHVTNEWWLSLENGGPDIYAEPLPPLHDGYVSCTEHSYEQIIQNQRVEQPSLARTAMGAHSLSTTHSCGNGIARWEDSLAIFSPEIQAPWSDNPDHNLLQTQTSSIEHDGSWNAVSCLAFPNLWNPTMTSWIAPYEQPPRDQNHLSDWSLWPCNSMPMPTLPAMVHSKDLRQANLYLANAEVVESTQ